MMDVGNEFQLMFSPLSLGILLLMVILLYLLLSSFDTKND